jgi:hypothetical protein
VVATLAAATAAAALPGRVFAYNCVNAVMRDPYWGQYPGVIQSGGMAAGVADAFAREGFSVDGTPDVGAIISWPPGAYGASTVGHVGLVDAVLDAVTMLVRHENWNGNPERTYQTALRPGMRFVHRKPAERAADAPAGQPADAQAI